MRYDISRSYEWNYDHAPALRDVGMPIDVGSWNFLGKSVPSPLGVAAGPLLNGRWILYYASLGFDVLTYKTVRSRARQCYALPNLQPVFCSRLDGTETFVEASREMSGSWAVSFGMPSKHPDSWRRDIEQTRQQLERDKVLSVSVVGTVQPGWSIEELANDYAQCARWAVESGADCVEVNFSCPNVSSRDGQLYQEPDAAKCVASTVRKAIGEVPLIVKIGHFVDHDLADRFVESIAKYTNAIATTNSIATAVQADDGTLMFDGQKRGICGKATMDASIHQTERLATLIRKNQHDVTLIGVGGIDCADDVRRYLDAGAESVQLATAVMCNPMVGIDIRRDMAKW